MQCLPVFKVVLRYSSVKLGYSIFRDIRVYFALRLYIQRSLPCLRASTTRSPGAISSLSQGSFKIRIWAVVVVHGFFLRQVEIGDEGITA